MPKQPLNILLRSKIFVAIIMGVLFLLGVLQLLQGLIDTRAYRQQIVAAVENYTGQDLVIKGEMQVSLLPLPTLHLPNVELKQAGGTAPSLDVDMVNIRILPSTLFSSSIQITEIQLEKPIMEITRDKSGKVDWDWIKPTALKLLQGQTSSDIGLVISDGKIVYHNENDEKNYGVAALNAEGGWGEFSKIGGFFVYEGHPVRFSGALSPSSSGKAMRLKFYTNDKNYAQLEGNVEFSDENTKIAGQLSLEADNLLQWSKAGATENQVLDQITNVSTKQQKENIVLPMQLTAQWQQENWTINLSQVAIKGMNSAGEGSFSMVWDAKPNYAASFDFLEFDYSQWHMFIEQVLGFSTSMNPPPAAFDSDASQNYEPIPKSFNLKLKLSADKLRVENQVWNTALLDATLDDGTVTVNQFGIELPGKSSLTLFGVISQGGTKGLRFEGSMETQGKSLRNILTVFDESAINLPETGLGDFYARANIYASPEQMRLSEADAKISELHLNGGLVAYFDTDPRIEADVRLRDINFDYFRDVWRKKQSEANPKDFFLRYDKSMNFDWLKRLHTRIDFRVNVENFTFMERQGPNASFRLFANDGTLGVYNVRFDYPNDTTEGSFSLDVKNEQPFISLVLNAVEVNTNYFSALPKNPGNQPAVGMPTAATPEPAEPESLPNVEIPNASPEPESQPAAAGGAPEGDLEKNVKIIPQAQAETVVADAKGASGLPARSLWSQELIDMSWMDGISGFFDISIGRLVHGDVVIDRLKTRAKLENNKLDFQGLSFIYWQGNCEITGSLFGGRVPGVSIGFTLYNAELHNILNAFVGRDNITGKVSISGQLSTSGVNYASWVSQSEGKMVFTGRGVNVTGFNLQGVMDAVSVSRTSADVFNNVSRAAFSGATEMSADGNINVRGGVLRTPGITLKSNGIVGNFSGEVRLNDFTMDMSALYQFPALTSETTPTMNIRILGALDKPELQTDTSSLEAYVAKRIIGR